MYSSTYFHNVNKSVTNDGKTTYNGILVASKLNQKNGQDYKLVDLVDIDFNGAWISSMNAYLYDAKDLLEILDVLNAQNDLVEVNQDLIKIKNQIQEIISTYVTNTSLEELLETNYQKKLSAGSYIKIDDDFTISVNGLPTFDNLLNYVNKAEFIDYQEYIKNNYPNKSEVRDIASEEANKAIDAVVAGADEAFDTLKEISDWILDQNRYTEVEWTELVYNWKDEYYYTLVDGKYVLVESPITEENLNKTTNYIKAIEKLDAGTTVYVKEDSKFVKIDSSYIDTNRDKTIEYFWTDTKYYKCENYLTDIQNLLGRVDRLDDAVGEKVEQADGTYSYSGHYADIWNLQQLSSKNSLEISYLYTFSDTLADLSVTAYNEAKTAYETANNAYNIAYESIQKSEESYELAQKSYDTSLEAITKVGEETIPGHYGKIESEEDLDRLIDDPRGIIYEYDEVNYKYIIIEDKSSIDKSKTYYQWIPMQPGTGLTGRVEEAEKNANNAVEVANVALESSYESLYHLMVNNTNASYVSLSLSPTTFDNDRNRTISITTSDGLINPKTGEILNNGLVNIDTALDIYAYASSWMMLYVDNDINFEDIQ